MTTFSEWLAKMLEEREMSPATLARLSKKDPGMISRLLKGERSASPDTLEAIALALHVAPEVAFRAAIGKNAEIAKDDLSPKKVELLKMAEIADEDAVEMALAVLEKAWERKKRK